MLLYRVGELVIVTILSGNESVVQETTCVYDHRARPSLPSQKWKYGFAVNDKDQDGKLQRSQQFFDGDGAGLHKIVLQDAGSLEAHRAIVKDFATVEQTPVLDTFRSRPLTANRASTASTSMPCAPMRRALTTHPNSLRSRPNSIICACTSCASPARHSRIRSPTIRWVCCCKQWPIWAAPSWRW